MQVAISVAISQYLNLEDMDMPMSKLGEGRYANNYYIRRFQICQ